MPPEHRPFVAAAALGLAATLALPWLIVRLPEQRDRAACDRDDVRACLRVADVLRTKREHGAARSLVDRAARVAEQRCAADPPRCGDLGHLLERVAPAQTERREQLERTACMGGLVDHCELTAARERDPRQRAVVLEWACLLGHERSCREAASLHRHEKGLDPARARSLLEASCARGDGLACHDLATMKQQGEHMGRSLDEAEALFARALPLLEAQCRGRAHDHASLGEACRLAGGQRARGHGCDRDLAEAVSLWQIGCDTLGGSWSCVELGMTPAQASIGISSISTGTPEQLDERCGRGLSHACLELRGALVDGRGVQADAQMARAVCEKGLTAARRRCDEGEPDGCVFVGDRLLHGECGGRDLAEAARAYERAEALQRARCDEGKARECRKLSRMYAKGEGAPHDLARAREAERRGVSALERICFAEGDVPRRADACLDAGVFSEQLELSRPDLATARRAYERCCAPGGPDTPQAACCGRAKALDARPRR